MDPMTRSEIFMAAAAGEYDGDPPTPVTRQEQYLKKIADRVNTGGGDGDSNDFVIRYAESSNEETPIVCDRTLAAIQAAYEAEKTWSYILTPHSTERRGVSGIMPPMIGRSISIWNRLPFRQLTARFICGRIKRATGRKSSTCFRITI